MIKKIVDFMIQEGTEQTTECNYIFYLEELTEKFNVSFEWIQENANNIITELESREEVTEVEQIGYESDNSFSIYFYMCYCPNAEYCEIEL